MKTLVIFFLACAAAASAEEAVTPTAQAEAVSPTAWDRIVLKDGQKLEGRIQGYDAFFLDVEGRNGTHFHLPWRELAEVAPAEFSGDTAMIRRYLTQDKVLVESKVEAKDPQEAFSKALWPGFAVHGYGHKVAGDRDMFLSLAGAEIFGVLVAGFGASKWLDAGVAQGDKDTAQYLVYGGGAMFALSWLWDLGFSARAARRYNADNKLALDARPGGALLALRREF